MNENDNFHVLLFQKQFLERPPPPQNALFWARIAVTHLHDTNRRPTWRMRVACCQAANAEERVCFINICLFSGKQQ